MTFLPTHTLISPQRHQNLAELGSQYAALVNVYLYYSFVRQDTDTDDNEVVVDKRHVLHHSVSATCEEGNQFCFLG